MKDEHIEALAQIHELSGNKAAAFTLRNGGPIGSVLKAQAEIIDRLVSEARAEGRRDGIEESADMADRWNTGIGEAIRNMTATPEADHA